MSVHAIFAAAGVALALGAAGCSDLTAPQRTGEPIQTDAVFYRATAEGAGGMFQQYGLRIVASFTNPIDRTVYLARCYPTSPGPMFGVPLVDGAADAESGYDPAWACVGHDRQFAIAPGEARTDTLHVLGPTGWFWDGDTHRALGVLEGRFRLSYRAQTCPGDGACPLPYDFARSNAFDVRLHH